MLAGLLLLITGTVCAVILIAIFLDNRGERCLNCKKPTNASYSRKYCYTCVPSGRKRPVRIGEPRMWKPPENPTQRP